VGLVGAVLCAIAVTSGLLLLGRAVQGLGGAIVTPAALSLLTTNFPTGRAHRVAMSAWTAAAAGGGALGFVLGGFLVDAAGWRGIFWLLTPLAALVLILMWPLIPPAPRVGRDTGLDVPGAFTATTGLVLLVWGAGLFEDPANGPVPPAVVIIVGVVLLVVFVVIERRSRNPLISWAELTNRTFMQAKGTAFINTATTSASGTLVALVAQRQLGLDAWTTGLVLVPFSVLVVIGSTTGTFWLTRRATAGMATGLALVSLAMLGLAGATSASSAIGLAIAVGVAGLGLSWAALTSTSSAMQSAAPTRQGTASGTVNTAAQIGTAIGVATLLSVASISGGGNERIGLSIAFITAAVIALGYSVLLLGSQMRTQQNATVEVTP